MNTHNFSPEKYIRMNGRKLPIEKCLITNSSQNALTFCIIVRKQPVGLYSIASFVVDRFCLGMKDTMVNCNFTKLKIDEMLDKMTFYVPLKEVSAVYFHNLIYGAMD